MVTDKFHFGLGVAPTLYVQPQTVFDLSIMAKVGYRLSKHCELGLSYQYGCLNTQKHFNTTIINPFPTSVEKALLFVFFRTGKGFSPTLTRNTYLFCSGSPGKAPAQETAGLQQNPAYKCQFAPSECRQLVRFQTVIQRILFNIFLISSTQFIAYQGVGIKRKCLPLRPTVRVRIQN